MTDGSESHTFGVMEDKMRNKLKTHCRKCHPAGGFILVTNRKTYTGEDLTELIQSLAADWKMGDASRVLYIEKIREHGDDDD